MFFNRLKIIFNRIIDADIYNFKSGAFPHHSHKVFAYVVNVPFDGTNNCFPNRRRSSFCEQRTQYCHPAFHSICGKKNFRNKQNPIPEIDPHNAHTFHQCFTQNCIRSPTAFQQNICPFFDFLSKSIVEVVMHLKD